MASVVPVQSPIVIAINRVCSMDSKQIAIELNRLVGLKITAAIGGVTETRRASDWAEGVPPRRLDALKAALQAASAITTRYGDAAPRPWFMSTNPRLGFRSPLAALRAAEQPEDYDAVVSCAVQDVS